MLLRNRRAELPGRWHSFTPRPGSQEGMIVHQPRERGSLRASHQRQAPFASPCPALYSGKQPWGPHRAGCPPELACADLRTPNRFQTNPVGFLVVCNSIKLTNWSLCPESFHRLYFSICQSGRPSDSRWLPAHSTNPMPTHHWGSMCVCACVHAHRPREGDTSVCAHTCTQAQRGRHNFVHAHVHRPREGDTSVCMHIHAHRPREGDTRVCEHTHMHAGLESETQVCACTCT